MKKILLMAFLLITNILLADGTHQRFLGGDLYKNRDYTELKEWVNNAPLSRDIEDFTINGWRFILMDHGGFDRDSKVANLFYKNGKFALISYFVDSAWNVKILDAIYIPAKEVPYRFVHSKRIYKDKHRSDFYSLCENSMHQWGSIIAIAAPESKYTKLNCEHKMKKIKKAWLIDEQNGSIGEISVDGISCLYVAENECNF